MRSARFDVIELPTTNVYYQVHRRRLHYNVIPASLGPFKFALPDVVRPSRSLNRYIVRERWHYAWWVCPTIILSSLLFHFFSDRMKSERAEWSLDLSFSLPLSVQACRRWKHYLFFAKGTSVSTRIFEGTHSNSDGNIEKHAWVEKFGKPFRILREWKSIPSSVRFNTAKGETVFGMEIGSTSSDER